MNYSYQTKLHKIKPKLRKRIKIYGTLADFGCGFVVDYYPTIAIGINPTIPDRLVRSKRSHLMYAVAFGKM